MKPNSPTVSVCIPTYNSASYVAQTLDSILAQTYQDVEIIVSDNASTDETVEILREYEATHGIQVHRNERNIGPNDNFNRLISLAKGKYTAIYHSDDLYEPTILEESVEVLDRNRDVGLVTTMAKVINAQGDYLYSYALPGEIAAMNKSIYSFEEAFLGVVLTLDRTIFFVTPSVMVRTAAYRELGFFDWSRYGCTIDYEMWLRIARRYKVGQINRELMRYRLHAQQGSEMEVRNNIELPDLLLVLDEYVHYVADAAIVKICRRFVDRTIIKTALKQNFINQFDKSSMSLERLTTPLYRLAGNAVACANMLGLNLHVRP